MGTGVCSRFLPARRYASAGNSDRNVSVHPSVCLSVCHAPVLCYKKAVLSQGIRAMPLFFDP